jgi:hypothetical protein
MNVEHLWNYTEGKTEVLIQESVLMPICRRYTPRGLAWALNLCSPGERRVADRLSRDMAV